MDRAGLFGARRDMKTIIVILYVIFVPSIWVYISGCPGVANGYVSCGVNEPRALFVALATGAAIYILIKSKS